MIRTNHFTLRMFAACGLLLTLNLCVNAQENTGLIPITPVDEVAPNATEAPVPSPVPSPPPPAPPKEVVSPNATAIVIDAGHGGRDVGFTADNGLTEKDLSLKLSEKVIASLKEKTGATSVGTRKEDTDMSNSERVRIANENNAALFVSIHAGVSRSAQANGIDLYIADTSNLASTDPQKDATKLAESSRALTQAIAEQFESQGIAKVRGIHQTPLRLLSEVSMPGLLIEVGYLSNAAEAELLNQDAHLDKIAQAIAAGIEQATKKEKIAP